MYHVFRASRSSICFSRSLCLVVASQAAVAAAIAAADVAAARYTMLTLTQES